MKTTFSLFINLIVPVAFALSILASNSKSDELASAIKPFTDESTIGLIHADLQKLNLDDLQKFVGQELEFTKEQKRQVFGPFQMSNLFLSGLKSGGVQRVVIMVSAEQNLNEIPPVIFELDREDQVVKIDQMIQAILPAGHSTKKSGKFLTIVTKNQTDQIIKRKSRGLDEVRMAINSNANSQIGLSIFLSATHQKIVREMFPDMSKPFDALDRNFVASTFRNVSIDLEKNDTYSLRIFIKTTDSDQAQKQMARLNATFQSIRVTPDAGSQNVPFGSVLRGFQFHQVEGGLELRIGPGTQCFEDLKRAVKAEWKKWDVLSKKDPKTK